MEDQHNSEFERIFVGGLQRDTLQEDLEKFFKRFCDIEGLELKSKKKQPECCVGFGTIFCSKESYDLILRKSFFEYRGRMIHCTPFYKGEKLEHYLKSLNSRRLNIWNISKNMTNRLLENYFESFGSIENAYILNEKEITESCLGSGFVVFKNREDAILALKQKFHIIEGVFIEVTQYQSEKEIRIGKETQKKPKKKRKNEIKQIQSDPSPVSLGVNIYSSLAPIHLRSNGPSQMFYGVHPQTHQCPVFFPVPAKEVLDLDLRFKATAESHNPGQRVLYRPKEVQKDWFGLPSLTRIPVPTISSYSLHFKIALNHTPKSIKLRKQGR